MRLLVERFIGFVLIKQNNRVKLGDVKEISLIRFEFEIQMFQLKSNEL